MTKLDWDREEQKRRARLRGREPVWRGLATGVAELRRRWQREHRFGEIWVAPALDEAAILVLLPPAEPGERWYVEFSQAGRVQGTKSAGGNPAVVRFHYYSASPWQLSVYHGDSLYDGFDDFWVPAART